MYKRRRILLQLVSQQQIFTETTLVHLLGKPSVPYARDLLCKTEKRRMEAVVD